MRLRLVVAGTSAGTLARERERILALTHGPKDDDPKTGYPPKYARDSIPEIKKYPDGQTLPAPKFKGSYKPGELLGCKSGELGLRKFLESRGHELVVTTDKDGPNSEAVGHLTGKFGRPADIVISQPFWPFYVTKDIIDKSPNLKMCMTAGIGSDHVDIEAACKRKITVTEVTFCNSISVAEHVMMQILCLVRNFVPSHDIIRAGGWNIADAVSRSYDLEGMHVGTIAAGRIGLAVLRRLKPFDVHLHYTDRHRLPAAVEKELNLTWHADPLSMVQSGLDVLTINCPLHKETEHLVNASFLSKMKRGSYIVNTARGKICDRDAVANALKSGHLAGYAGDVWFPQPPPKDHPWRSMPHHAMTPHISGTSLSAQHRYAAGVMETLEAFFDSKPIRNEYLIAQDGKLAGVGAHSYTLSNSTGGSEEAAKFKRQ